MQLIHFNLALNTNHRIFLKPMKKLTILLSCSLLACCQSNSSFKNRYVQCDSTVFVKDFPQIVTLSPPEILDIQCHGATEINTKDSLLIVQKSGEPFFEIFNLNKKKLEGKFVSKGNGPGEFILSKRIQSLYSKDNQYIAEIYNDDKVTMDLFNISESILQQKAIIESSIRKPQRALSSYFINDSIEYIYRLNDDYTQVQRFVKMFDLPPKEILGAKKLNDISVRDIEEISLLTSVVVINRDKLLAAEAPLAHKQINLYSILDNSTSLTICLDEQLKSIEDLQRVDKNDMVRYYGNIRSYDNFFVALYVERQKDRQTERTLPSLHIFSWEGEPIAIVKLNELCDSFDIDFINKKLITLDVVNERFFIYDIPSVGEINIVK